jgi:hypothetical protein
MTAHHAGTHGSEHNVAGELQQISVSLHQDCFVTALKDVIDAGMRLVEALRIDAVELPHALGEIAVRSFYQQMVVIPHLAVGMNDPVEALADLPGHLQPDLTTPVLEIDGLPPSSPGR